MKRLNCTVKDVFRRQNMIVNAVRMLADNGYTEHAATYAVVRDNMNNALAYVSAHMDMDEYRAAELYLNSKKTEKEVADIAYFTDRTVRRHICKACDLIARYYAEYWGIILMPTSVKSVECTPPAGTLWEKINSAINGSIENACIAAAYFCEHDSVNYICNNYKVGIDKVKKIVAGFNSTATLMDMPAEKRHAV